MEAYKERFIIEYKELEERKNKLYEMLKKYELGTLEFTPSCPISLLRKQYQAMCEYLYCLNARAEIEKINLKGDE